jgi:hypothetical protein
MATDPKLAGRELDEARRLEFAKLEVRQETRTRNQLLSSPEEEDTGVIESEALQRVKAGPSSTPPHAKSLVAVLNTLPGWGRVVVLLALIAALATGGSKLSGLW